MLCAVDKCTYCLVMAALRTEQTTVANQIGSHFLKKLLQLPHGSVLNKIAKLLFRQIRGLKKIMFEECGEEYGYQRESRRRKIC